MKLLNLDSPIIKALFFIGDLIILNALFLVCCVPVVTVGASAASLYTVSMRMAAKDDRGIVKPFFTAFKENLRKATMIWLFFLLIGSVFALGITLIIHNRNVFPDIIKVLYGIVIIIYLMGLSWVFPLQARFENTVKNTIKNAFIIGISRIGKSVLIVILMMIPILMAAFLTEFFISSGFVWTLCGFSVIAVLQSLVINEELRQYTAPSAEIKNRLEEK